MEPTEYNNKEEQPVVSGLINTKVDEGSLNEKGKERIQLQSSASLNGDWSGSGKIVANAQNRNDDNAHQTNLGDSLSPSFMNVSSSNQTNPWRRTISRLSIGKPEMTDGIPFIDCKLVSVETCEAAFGPFRPTQYTVNLKGGFLFGRKLPQSTVTRRFSDFVWLREEWLVKRYPFRLVPLLPPKRLQAYQDAAFMVERQVGLQRFLSIVLFHPIMALDEMLQAFLTETGCPWRQWLKENAPLTPPDEEILPLEETMNPEPEGFMGSLVQESLAAMPVEEEEEGEFIADAIAGSKYYGDRIEDVLQAIEGQASLERKCSLFYQRFATRMTDLAGDGDSPLLGSPRSPSRCGGCGEIGQTASRISRALQTVSEVKMEAAAALVQVGGPLEELRILANLFAAVGEMLERVAQARQYNGYTRLVKTMIGIQAQLEKAKLCETRSPDQTRNLEQSLKKTHEEYQHHYQRDQCSRKCAHYDLAWLHHQQHSLLGGLHRYVGWLEENGRQMHVPLSDLLGSL